MKPSARRALPAASAVLAVLASLSCGRAQTDVPEAVTFNRHIAPIVLQSCAPCHRPGEAGPFSLLTYADVRRRAEQVARVTQVRFMPPWPPEPGYGDLAGSRRLRRIIAAAAPMTVVATARSAELAPGTAHMHPPLAP